MRIAFLNVDAAMEALPRITEIMAQELKWDKKEQKRQMDAAAEFLKTEMGLRANREIKKASMSDLSKDEVGKYTNKFNALDKDRKGYIGINDLRRSVKVRIIFTSF